jgi:glycosyltransferase involved in cell wall biosynthesis
LRVLQIIPSLDRAGAEKQLTLLATRLPRDEFDVQVCVLTRLGPLQDELQRAQIPVVCVQKTWKVDPAAYSRLKHEIRRVQPDLVQTWIFAANSYGRKAALAVGVPRIVASERCVDRWKTWTELAIDRYLARRTDRIVVNSSGVRDFYVGRGLPQEKFLVIPNGIDPVDIDPVDNRPEGREELLRELELPPAARLIAAVGRLWPQKRYKDLIWAADLLKVIRDDVHLLIIGEGPQRERLERYRDLVQIQDRVHFLGHRTDVPRLLPHLDCFWLGSGYEGQSNALMEAMMQGVPVVASDIAGNRDLVVHGETGYLYPLGDRAALARWTNIILNDAPLARRLGSGGRRRMLDEFSVDKMVARYADLYRRLAAQGERATA